MSTNGHPGIGRTVGRTIGRALVDSFQWRLLLLWIIALTLPTVMVAWPLWQALGGALDHALNAADLARKFDIITMMEATLGWRDAGYSPFGSATGALVVTLLLSPWLSGLAITAAAAAAVDRSRPPGFAALMHGGFVYYGRLARMLLWSTVPLFVVTVIGGGLLRVVAKRAEHAILESNVELWRAIVWVIFALLLLIVHASLEAGRARFAVDPHRRSAVRAWWRGGRDLKRRPVAMFGSYLAITALGLITSAGLGIVRLDLPPIGVVGFALAWLATQLIVGVIVWSRCARLFALFALESGVARESAETPG